MTKIKQHKNLTDEYCFYVYYYGTPHTHPHVLMVVLACKMQRSEVLFCPDVNGDPMLHQQLYHLVMAL